MVKEDLQDVQVKQFLAMMNNDLSVIVEDDDASVRETANENLSQKNPSSLIGKKSQSNTKPEEAGFYRTTTGERKALDQLMK